MLEPQQLGKVITEETGLEFEVSTGVDSEGQRWYLLRPHGLLADHTFGIRTTLGWRRIRIDFEPGKFAGSLLSDMGKVDADGRSVFHAVLADCHRLGSRIDFRINGVVFPYDSKEVWTQTWNRLNLSIDKGQLELGVDESESDTQIICSWTGRFAASVVALLPTEELGENVDPEVIGYPEGAVISVQTNRYERDRRNRAAAFAIHGTTCKGCGLEMGVRYGSIAAGFIEIHHVTPVSQLGAGYVIDPVHDLVPLCPNCHSVVHRRTPPLTLVDLQELLEQSRGHCQTNLAEL